MDENPNLICGSCSSQFRKHASNVNSSRKEALLYIFEDKEAVIHMIVKGRSPTMRPCFPEPTELLLIGCFYRINLDTQDPNQIHRHQKNNSQTYRQRAISHVMNGSHLVVFVQHQPFSVASIVPNRCRKRTQQDASEERVTTKSKPVMNFGL